MTKPHAGNSRQRISSGSVFEERIGYSRAVRDGDWVFVSGTAGFDYKTGTISEDAAQQTEKIFETLQHVLGQAGVTLADLVRVRIWVSEQQYWAPVTEVVGKYLRPARPAATGLVSGMVDPRMKVEIEVTAKVQS
jgi:enamine deaminase RidA (YjgF/YER057c/UK114 family)